LSQNSKNRNPYNNFKKWLLILAGTISLALGTIGVIVPLLPTTPFLLITAACYIRSSDRLYRWLMNHRVYGKFLHNYLENKAIALNVKIGSISLLWVTVMSSAFFFISLTWIRVLLFIIALAVTIHIFSFKTIR